VTRGAAIRRDVSAALRALERQRNVGWREFRGLVDNLRQKILLAVMQDDGLSRGTASEVKARVDAITRDYEARFLDQMTEDQRRVFVKGLRVVDNSLKAGGITLALPYLSEHILSQARDFNAELVRGLTEDARGKIVRELQLSVIGQKPATDVIKAIGKGLNSPGVFKSVATRAAVIYQTEMARMQNLASEKRMAQAVGQVPDLMKEWRHSHLGVPRPNHLAMAGAVVKANGKFTLEGINGGTYEIDGPHDPILPAEEVVNCKCVCIPVVERFQSEKKQSA